LAAFIPDSVREAYLPEAKDIHLRRGKHAGHVSLKFLFGGSVWERLVNRAKYFFQLFVKVEWCWESGESGWLLGFK